MAITVGSVEVDVIPNVRGIEGRLRAGLVPSATRIGDEVGQIIGRQMAAQIAAAVRDGITTGGTTARPAAARQGDDTAGAFGRAFRSRLQAAMRDLPKADVRIGDTGFNADMDRLRARLETLSNKRIGVDVDAATALAEITRIEEDLRRLGAQHPDVNVRVDTAAALGELAALRAEVSRLDGDTATIDVDTSAAEASLGGLTAAAIAFGPAILPILPVVAAGLGAIAAAGAAAAAGVGAIALVAVPAFHQIGTVLQAQKAAQDAATNATYRGGQASAQGASRALQMASAQQAVATAARNGARQIAQAEQQVTQARQAAAQVADQAAQRTQQAERQVVQAEKDLSQAQKEARQAQLDLTAARKEAARQLEDMNNQLADSQLSLRDAQLQVTEARQNLNAVNAAGSKATALQRQEAQLQYDEAVQHLKEQQTATKRAQSDTAAANKAGVAGSQTVKRAQDQLAQSQQAVADKTQALKDAQQNQARVAAQNAREIAQAQQRIADAQSNVAVAQQNAADAAASAQRQLQQASVSAAGGVDQAAVAQSKYQAALAKLTPSARQTYFAFLDLRTAFSAWSRALQPAVMPIFTRALAGLKSVLPQLTPFVLAAASAIKGLQDRAAAGFQSPWWQTFRKDLQGAVVPAITGLGIAFGHIFKGMVGIVDAFLPHMAGISSTLQRITGKFAAWAGGLKGSPAFEQFLSFAADKGPLIAQALGSIFTAFLNIGTAVSPLSGPLLQVITGLAQGVGWLAQNVPGLVIAVYGLYVATKLWAAWQIIVNGAMTAFNIISKAGPWGWIVLAIAAVVLAVIYMYKHFTWFRDGVQAVWKAIQFATSWLWNNALKPVFTAIGAIVVWLWQYIIKPHIAFVIALWKVLAAVAIWLWKNIMAPTFHAMGDLIVWWWKYIVRPNFNLVKDALRGLGVVFKWLYDNAVKPVWNAISTAIQWNYQHVIKPSFEALKTAIGHVADAFKAAKDGIGKQWAKIRDLTKIPINFVIGTVWNNGIVAAWKKITGWIPGVPKLGTLPLLAQGGTLPVQPGVFNRPTAIVGEGDPRHPEYVIPTDPRYRKRALALHAAAGSQLLAGGGIIGDIVGGISHLGSSISSAIGSAASFVADPGKALDKLLGHLLGPLQAGKNTAFGKLALALPKAILDGLKSLVSGGGGGAGLGDLGAHGASAKQAQNIARLLLPSFGWGADQMPPLVSLWNGESGWRWNALNAASGAYGIPQSLPASKMASAGADWKTSAGTQIKWGLGYIKSRYGSPANAWSTWQLRSPHWYDTGGMLQPGMNLAFNGTGRPEPVLTTQQWNLITDAASKGHDGSQQPVIVELHAKEGELGQFIDVRVLDHQQNLVQVLNAS